MVDSCYSYCQATDCFELIPSEICIEIIDDTQKVFEVEIMDNEGDPIDITNDTITFTVKDEFGGITKLQKINTVGGHSDPTNGKTTFTILQADIPSASPYEVRNWVYEIRRTDASLVEDVHLQGDFIVNPVVGV